MQQQLGRQHSLKEREKIVATGFKNFQASAHPSQVIPVEGKPALGGSIGLTPLGVFGRTP
jgi:hypothetical protein